MTEIKIQKATIENLEDIQKLNLMLFEKEYREYDKCLNCDWTFGKEGTDYFKKKITEDNSCAFIAKSNEDVVGYLVGGLTKAEDYRKLPKTAELENTFVLKECRSKGIGTKLYDAFIDWCETKGVKLIRVNASAQNEGAIKFYRKNKFNDYSLTLESKI
jgi:ribosomal protein S18 acetylase RimI-like enzyme